MFVGDISGSEPTQMIFGADRFEHSASLIEKPYYGMNPDKFDS